jgi:cellobiose-specific phosphotransferase system component IIC
MNNTEPASSGIKLGRTELILVIAGLVALISSFLHWFQASVSASDLGTYYAGSTDGWSSGIAAWGAILLLVAVGVMALLPAFDVAQNLQGRYRLFTILAGIALVLVILRWATYPSTSVNDSGAQLSEGAGLGTFLCLIAALAATGFSFLALRVQRRGPRAPAPPAPPFGFPGQQ